MEEEEGEYDHDGHVKMQKVSMFCFSVWCVPFPFNVTKEHMICSMNSVSVLLGVMSMLVCGLGGRIF